jgi:hypothetical protein
MRKKITSGPSLVDFHLCLTLLLLTVEQHLTCDMQLYSIEIELGCKPIRNSCKVKPLFIKKIRKEIFQLNGFYAVYQIGQF